MKPTPTTLPPFLPEDVAAAVRVCANFKPGQLEENTQRGSTSRPRMIGMYLCVKFMWPTVSYIDIGKAFGGFHHTSVIYAARRIERLRRYDLRVVKFMQTLCERLNVAVPPLKGDN